MVRFIPMSDSWAFWPSYFVYKLFFASFIPYLEAPAVLVSIYWLYRVLRACTNYRVCFISLDSCSVSPFHTNPFSFSNQSGACNLLHISLQCLDKIWYTLGRLWCLWQTKALINLYSSISPLRENTFLRSVVDQELHMIREDWTLRSN